MSNFFDEDYFENGIVTGKSCYINYRWMPELTIKMAHKLIKYLDLNPGDRVLDFGCAKGFLVKALRILDIDAFGCDVSSYAIDMVDPEVRSMCKLMRDNTIIPFNQKFDWIISKDVLEHIQEKDVDMILRKSHQFTDRMFHIVPLANKREKFIIPEYELDKSHILKKDLNWWIKKFESTGWKLASLSYSVEGVKDNWTSKYKKGNAFFILNKK
jgi:cyclopropane fatty-acyl-phospholipid synthase-like methyltransferase